jgi:hypothetical protein
MGKGLANALLIASREAFRGATPISKVTTPGFLQYLLNNNKPQIISQGKDDGSGYMRDIKIRYRQRGVPGKTVTTDDCSVQARPAYLETTVPATQFRALGLAFEDDLIATFERDALAQVSAGTPQMTSIMKDVYEGIVEQANGFFADVNNDLLALQAAGFGKNQVTGLNTARTVNFPLNATNNDLATGMTLVQADAMANEVKLTGAAVVGSGLVNNYFLQQVAKSAAQNGLDTSRQFLPNFYFDPYAATGWGSNQFGLFEKDAVQFVNTCRFRGAKSGQKGSDFFMTLKLPIIDSLGQSSLGAFEFDVQLTYRTCPDEVQIGTYAAGTNEPVLLQRGWNIILMSSYQTVNIPADSYASGDRLNGVNGTFRYVATNA